MAKKTPVLKTLPHPKNIIEEYLKMWNELPGYPAQEDILDDYFRENGTFTKNTNEKEVLLKVVLLDRFYSTHLALGDVLPMVRGIVNLNIDEKLEKAEADPNIVMDIAKCTMDEKNWAESQQNTAAIDEKTSSRFNAAAAIEDKKKEEQKKGKKLLFICDKILQPPPKRHISDLRQLCSKCSFAISIFKWRKIYGRYYLQKILH